MKKLVMFGAATAKMKQVKNKKLCLKQSLNCDIPIDNYGIFKGRISLPKNKKYQLIIDYPLSEKAIFNINTGKNGMGEIQLINKILKAYRRVYEHGTRYKIWGHGIEDLALEGIQINHKTKIIRLDVGS